MSFQALARTWRPRRFDQLVGQAHVVRALTHALDQNKLHHALLFSGTRGVGKTTLARIIAKCLNCEQGVSASPCVGEDACATCQEIDQGRYVDLIEVDAASRTGVDDTRELMDNVQYAPTRGRTKVYLIDEVHMLTKHSFNALLKTLEEPPPRVQFLLATTEPEKIPITILSRCLQFPLKRLPAAQIADRLRHIVNAESLGAEDDALVELARAADGSMRDGLSLLDQAVAFGGGQLTVDDVREMLGTIGEARVAELVDAIVDARATDALVALEALYAQGIDMRYLLDAMATAWQHMAIIQVVGEAVDDAGEPWLASAGRADPMATQMFYDITLAGIRDFVHAPDPLVGVKMTVLRMLAFAPGPEHRQKSAGSATTPAADDGGAAPQSTPTRSGLSAREAMAKAREKLRTPSGRRINQSSPDGVAQVPEAGSVREFSEIPAPQQLAATPDGPAADSPASVVAVAPDPASTPDVSSSRTSPAEPAPDATATTPDEPSHTADSFDFQATTDHPEDWHALVPQLGVSGFAAQLANNGICRHLDAERIELELARTHAFLATDAARESLQSALAELWGARQVPHLQLKLVDAVGDTPAMRSEADAEQRQRDAVASIENDPIIKQLCDQLGARLRPETIKPHRAPHRAGAAIQQRDEP